MHSYDNNLLPNHFDAHFIPISSIHSRHTKLSTSYRLFYLELTHLQENVPLHLLIQKCGPQHQTALSPVQPLPPNGNLQNTTYTKKIHNYTP